MEWISVAKWVALVVGLASGLFLGWKEWKERRVRANGLAPNPTRCEDHEGRLRKVENWCSEIRPQIEGLEKGMDEVKSGVNKLIDLHLAK